MDELSDVKHEYLGGAVHAMAGATDRHNMVVGNASAALHGSLRSKPCQPFNSDTKIRIKFPDQTRFYCPGTMVVCAPNRAEDRFQDRPVVVIEVLSDSTRRTDLGEKLDAYPTIPSLEVLLYAEPDIPVVTVHRRRAAGGFAIEHHSGFDAVIPLPEIEAQLTLADLYERVTFAA